MFDSDIKDIELMGSWDEEIYPRLIEMRLVIKKLFPDEISFFDEKICKAPQYLPNLPPVGGLFSNDDRELSFSESNAENLRNKKQEVIAYLKSIRRRIELENLLNADSKKKIGFQ